ncbi:MAG: hypothetical protein Kow00109_07130 [Acidobacteriota bacterium]
MPLQAGNLADPDRLQVSRSEFHCVAILRRNENAEAVKCGGVRTSFTEAAVCNWGLLSLETGPDHRARRPCGTFDGRP